MFGIQNSIPQRTSSKLNWNSNMAHTLELDRFNEDDDFFSIDFQQRRFFGI
jgi:hypothetical protein